MLRLSRRLPSFSLRVILTVLFSSIYHHILNYVSRMSVNSQERGQSPQIDFEIKRCSKLKAKSPSATIVPTAYNTPPATNTTTSIEKKSRKREEGEGWREG